MNKIIDIFEIKVKDTATFIIRDETNPTIKFINEAKAFKREMLKDHCCEYCIHATEQPHVAYGEDGTDVFCQIFNELKLEYDDGMQCIFWEENTEKTEEFR